MRFVPFLDLSIDHSYYLDGRCRSLAVEPTDEARLLARNHHCELRSHIGGLQALVRVDSDGKPFLPWPDMTRWRFRLTVEDPAFHWMTDLSELETHDAPRYVLPDPPSSDGSLVLTSNPGGSLPIGTLADVELLLPLAPESPVTLNRFKIQLSAQEARWAYYCVTNSRAQTAEDGEILDLFLANTDSNGGGEILFGEPQELSESGGSDGIVDPVADELAGRFPGMRRLLFLSEEKIPCRRRPKTHLELRKGSDRLVGPLPAPSIQRRRTLAGSDEIHLFQVVRYITHTSI